MLLCRDARTPSHLVPVKHELVELLAHVSTAPYALPGGRQQMDKWGVEIIENTTIDDDDDDDDDVCTLVHVPEI